MSDKRYKPIYSCSGCAEDYSWPKEDLSVLPNGDLICTHCLDGLEEDTKTAPFVPEHEKEIERLRGELSDSATTSVALLARCQKAERERDEARARGDLAVEGMKDAHEERDELKDRMNHGAVIKRKINREVVEILGKKIPTDPEHCYIPPTTLARDLVEAREAVGEFQIRVAFIGWPTEPWNENGPDWSYEIALAERAIHGTPVPEKVLEFRKVRDTGPPLAAALLKPRSDEGTCCRCGEAAPPGYHACLKCVPKEIQKPTPPTPEPGDEGGRGLHANLFRAVEDAIGVRITPENVPGGNEGLILALTAALSGQEEIRKSAEPGEEGEPPAEPIEMVEIDEAGGVYPCPPHEPPAEPCGTEGCGGTGRVPVDGVIHGKWAMQEDPDTGEQVHVTKPCPGCPDCAEEVPGE